MAKKKGEETTAVTTPEPKPEERMNEWPGNSEVAREALATGLTTPAEAVEFARRKYPGAEFNESSFKSGFSSMKTKDMPKPKVKPKPGGLEGIRELVAEIRKSGDTLEVVRDRMDEIDRLAGLVGGHDKLRETLDIAKELGGLLG